MILVYVVSLLQKKVTAVPCGAWDTRGVGGMWHIREGILMPRCVPPTIPHPGSRAVERVPELWWASGCSSNPLSLQMSKPRPRLEPSLKDIGKLLVKKIVSYNLKGSVMFLLVEGFAQWWWLLIDQHGGYWRHFLKVRQRWSLPHHLTLPFTNDFSVTRNLIQ